MKTEQISRWSSPYAKRYMDWQKYILVYSKCRLYPSQLIVWFLSKVSGIPN